MQNVDSQYVVDVQLVQFDGKEWPILSYLWKDDRLPQIGDLVLVPFGRKNEIRLGVVLWSSSFNASADTSLQKDYSDILTHIGKRTPPKHITLKEVDMILSPWRIMQQQICFALRISKYNLIHLGNVLKLMVPFVEVLNSVEIHIKKWQIAENVSIPLKLTAKQKLVWEYLQQNGSSIKTDILKNCDVTEAVIKRMQDNGLLLMTETIHTECEKTDSENVQSLKEISLSEHQQNTCDALMKNFEVFAKKAQLLKGPPSSGKTEVYMKLVKSCLQQNQQVLILLPEIMLTNMFCKRLREHFGNLVHLWHGSVTKKNKRQIWQDANAGKSLIVLGTRSSLFIPFKNLGLIVVDEEHDSSYKQEGVRTCYHARDVAVWRGVLEDVKVLLVSATPSIETVHNVMQDRYSQVILNQRFFQTQSPQVSLIDMNQANLPWGQWISNTLYTEIEKCLQQKNQALLFLNRRGYAPVVSCRKCSFRFCCKHCSSWLTAHGFGKYARLRCHYCNFSEALARCPKCESDGFQMHGPGVERIHEEIRNKFPNSRIVVISSDKVRREKDMQDLVNSIVNRDYDIIIGTQILAKGYNFPHLTLVALVDADLGFHGGEFRASEQNFQLIVQVSGRSGRHNKSGKVMVQTYYPKSEVMQHVIDLNQNAFYLNEIENRKRTLMPPFSRIVLVTFKSKYENSLSRVVHAASLSQPKMDKVEIWGPSTPYISKIKGVHRRFFLWRSHKDFAVQKHVQRWILNLSLPESVAVRINVDPYNIMT